MHETLEEFLTQTAERKDVSDYGRKLAKRLLDQWNHGIIPSQGELSRLKNLIPQSTACARLEWDGACEWLRTTGHRLGLQTPPEGERAMCVFKHCFSRCPGFVPLRGNE